MKKIRFGILPALLIILVVALAACSSNEDVATPAPTEAAQTATPIPTPPPEPESIELGALDGAYYVYDILGDVGIRFLLFRDDVVHHHVSFAQLIELIDDVNEFRLNSDQVSEFVNALFNLEQTQETLNFMAISVPFSASVFGVNEDAQTIRLEALNIDHMVLVEAFRVFFAHPIMPQQLPDDVENAIIDHGIEFISHDFWNTEVELFFEPGFDTLYFTWDGAVMRSMPIIRRTGQDSLGAQATAPTPTPVPTPTNATGPEGTYYREQDGLWIRTFYFSGDTVNTHRTTLFTLDAIHGIVSRDSNHLDISEFQPLFDALSYTPEDGIMRLGYDNSQDFLDFYTRTTVVWSGTFEIVEDSQHSQYSMFDSLFEVEEGEKRIHLGNFMRDGAAGRQAIYDFFSHSFIQSLDIQHPSPASISLVADIFVDGDDSVRRAYGTISLLSNENFDTLRNSAGTISIRH